MTLKGKAMKKTTEIQTHVYKINVGEALHKCCTYAEAGNNTKLTSVTPKVINCINYRN